MLGAAVAGSLMAGAVGGRGPPRGAGFALPPWCRAWAWALVLPAGYDCGVAVDLGCCLAVDSGGGLALGLGLAAGFRFGWAAGAGFAGERCRPRFAGSGSSGCGALAVAGTTEARIGLRACLGGVARGLGCGVPGQGSVVEVDEVVFVVKVVESEAEEKDVGESQGSQMQSGARPTDVQDCGVSRTAQAGAGCLVLWARRVRVQVRASGVCTRSPWRAVCVQVPVPWVVSCVVRGGVGKTSWRPGLVSCLVGVQDSSRTCSSDCRRQWRIPKKAAGCRACPPP